MIQIALDEGATTINIPDTVGYADAAGVRGVPDRVCTSGCRACATSSCRFTAMTISVWPVANSFAGDPGRRAAGRVPRSTGIGERAGNASIEEIIMLLHTRQADRRLTTTAAVTREIARASRLVSRLTGYSVQPNKAIVGRNAFAHESGIHQDGVLKERSAPTRSWMLTTCRAWTTSTRSCWASTRAAMPWPRRCRSWEYELQGSGAEGPRFKRFKEIADKKKQVTAMDLEALVADELRQEAAGYSLAFFEVDASSRRPPHATVGVNGPDGDELTGSFTGDGPIDAIFHAINAATGVDARLREFNIGAVTDGQDALGETSVVVEVGGRTGAGQGVSTDILDAAASAYVRALSAAVRRQELDAEAQPP